MQGSLDQPPIILTALRKGGVRLLVLGLLFTGVGATAIMGSKVSALGVGAFVLGLGSFCLGLMTAVSPAQLAIAPGGLELRTALRTRKFSWDEVAAFRVVTLRKVQLVGFDRTGAAAPRGPFRDLWMALVPAHVSSPYDMTIPGKWPDTSAEAVAGLLNDARARWGGVQAAQALELRPRGSSGQRIDRRLYWLAICVLVAISVLIAALTHGARVSGYLTLMWIWIYARRLHDIGRSGWWQAAALGALVVLGVVLIVALHWREQTAVGLVLLLQLAFTVVLGAIPGDLDANRFGAPPGAPPLEAATEVFR